MFIVAICSWTLKLEICEPNCWWCILIMLIFCYCCVRWEFFLIGRIACCMPSEKRELTSKWKSWKMLLLLQLNQSTLSLRTTFISRAAWVMFADWSLISCTPWESYYSYIPRTISAFFGRMMPSHLPPLLCRTISQSVIFVRQNARTAHHSLRSARFYAIFHALKFLFLIPQTAAQAAAQQTLDPENQKYHVLMVVTDGVINDMGNTMDSLVSAADLPMSVIMWAISRAFQSLTPRINPYYREPEAFKARPFQIIRNGQP